MRVFIVGAGVIARRHAEAAQKLVPADTLELRVTDVNPAALADFVREFPTATPFADLDSMLEGPASASDIVVVATPPFTHRDIAVTAFDSGRNVLCEKPLAMNPDEAREMLSAARRNERHLASCDTRLIGTAASDEVGRLLSVDTFGQVYHVTWMNRGQRGRTGIEYQPETRWFLNKDLNGGGTLMDWGPYDFALLDHLFDPVRVEVLSAWLATPETGVVLPSEVVLDTEQHVGASLRFTTRAGARIDVTFERAACTHGEPRTIVEIEGTRGAVSWQWLDWGSEGTVRITEDREGKAVSRVELHPSRGELEAHDRPLHYLIEFLRGAAPEAIVDGRTVFPFLVLQAVYACALTGSPQTVSREGL